MAYEKAVEMEATGTSLAEVLLKLLQYHVNLAKTMYTRHTYRCADALNPSNYNVDTTGMNTTSNIKRYPIYSTNQAFFLGKFTNLCEGPPS